MYKIKRFSIKSQITNDLIEEKKRIKDHYHREIVDVGMKGMDFLHNHVTDRDDLVGKTYDSILSKGVDLVTKPKIRHLIKRRDSEIKKAIFRAESKYDKL